MKNILLYLFLPALFSLTGCQNSEADPVPPSLRISETDRILVNRDGSPFIWLGSTAWALHQNLSREDVLFYLDNAGENGFTVVQLFCSNRWALDDFKNYYGHSPYLDGDPTQLNPAYWEHLRWVIEEAGLRDLNILFVYGGPGRKDERMPYVNSQDEAYEYGYHVGEALRGLDNIIWAGGMDNDPTDTTKLAPMGFEGWHAMAEGVNDGVAGTYGYDNESDYSLTLMTYHVNGQNISTRYFHDAPWLDFNAAQLGMQAGNGNDSTLICGIMESYFREPVKPILNLEPWYENNTWREKPVDAHEVRVQAYQSLFSGAAGFTYGNKNIWAMSRPSAEDRDLWKKHLDDPGRKQMVHLRSFLDTYSGEKIPYPTGHMVTGSEDPDFRSRRLMHRISACHSPSGERLYVYSPLGFDFELDLDSMQIGQAAFTWFDPRSESYSASMLLEGSPQSFSPPEEGTDWLLLIE